MITKYGYNTAIWPLKLAQEPFRSDQSDERSECWGEKKNAQE